MWRRERRSAGPFLARRPGGGRSLERVHQEVVGDAQVLVHLALGARGVSFGTRGIDRSVETVLHSSLIEVCVQTGKMRRDLLGKRLLQHDEDVVA